LRLASGAEDEDGAGRADEGGGIVKADVKEPLARRKSGARMTNRGDLIDFHERLALGSLDEDDPACRSIRLLAEWARNPRRLRGGQGKTRSERYREHFQKSARSGVYAQLRVEYRKWAADTAIGRKQANQRCAAEAVRIFKESGEKYGKISLRQAVREGRFALNKRPGR
jgi:hypothetical protein